MPRPLSNVAPKLAVRGGVFYAVWYEPLARRTRRVSLKTSDRATAEARVGEVSRQAAPGGAWRRMALKMCRRARENAKRKRRVYSLTADDVLEKMAAQKYRCAVSGIPLLLTGAKRCPWAPSLDQIVPGAGYTPENVRVVAMLVNTAMNGWGEVVLRDFLAKVGLRAA